MTPQAGSEEKIILTGYYGLHTTYTRTGRDDGHRKLMHEFQETRMKYNSVFKTPLSVGFFSSSHTTRTRLPGNDCGSLELILFLESYYLIR